jgi:hypothetical protein
MGYDSFNLRPIVHLQRVAVDCDLDMMDGVEASGSVYHAITVDEITPHDVTTTSGTSSTVCTNGFNDPYMITVTDLSGAWMAMRPAGVDGFSSSYSCSGHIGVQIASASGTTWCDIYQSGVSISSGSIITVNTCFPLIQTGAYARIEICRVLPFAAVYETIPIDLVSGSASYTGADTSRDWTHHVLTTNSGWVGTTSGVVGAPGISGYAVVFTCDNCVMQISEPYVQCSGAV